MLRFLLHSGAIHHLALGLVLLAFGASCTTDRLQTPTREQVIQQILPSSVQIVLEQNGQRFRSGSGVIVAARAAATEGQKCLVLTSGHTLNGLSAAHDVYVLLERHRGKGTRAHATVLAQRDSHEVDIALLQIETSGCTAAEIGPAPALGDAVWVVAFPWGRNMTLTGGNVSQIRLDGPNENDGRLMVDASVSYGASGGGVFEASTGRLIGLVEGYRTARVSFEGDAAMRYIDVPVPGETYVTSVADIERFLTAAGYPALLSKR